MTDDTSNPTLTAVDLAVLAALRDGRARREVLATRAALPPSTLDDRLVFLTDNGLVREDTSDEAATGDGRRFELTDSGRQVLRAPGDGTGDNSLGVPPDVERALEARGLAPDRRDAVREAFAFLRYWGRATAAELRDGVFSEVPLDFESPGAWWSEVVRDHLAALPHVEAPAEDDGFWAFTGTPGVSETGGDPRFARAVRGADEGTPYASATEALTDLGLDDDERLAVAGALAALQRGEREPSALRRAAATVRAGRRPPEDWLDADLFDVLARLPGVVSVEEGWAYTLTPEGYAARTGGPPD